MNEKVQVGIVGATGYTGSELARFLLVHPHVTLAGISSESYAGKPFSEVHSLFQSICDQKLVTARELLDNRDIELVFLALPHGVSMEFVRDTDLSERKIVDLSGDFRLDSKQTYDAWYPKEHVYPEGFEGAVYGLPELFADDIRDARLVANPGCYPTASILGVAPLVDAGHIEASVIVDAKSGVTGAGVKPKISTHFSNVHDDFKAYGLPLHRHTIEIELAMDRLDGETHRVQFTPHLLPVDRGILATIYCKPSSIGSSTKAIGDVYGEFYRGAPFIRWRDQPPSIKDVRGTNYCDIHAYYDERSERIIVFSAIDNLVKGAAGQAVQNMNLMLGFAETSGLGQIPLRP